MRRRAWLFQRNLLANVALFRLHMLPVQIGQLLIDQQSQPDKKRHVRLLQKVVDSIIGTQEGLLNHVGFRNPPGQPIVQPKLHDPLQAVMVLRK